MHCIRRGTTIARIDRWKQDKFFADIRFTIDDVVGQNSCKLVKSGSPAFIRWSDLNRPAHFDSLESITCQTLRFLDAT